MLYELNQRHQPTGINLKVLVPTVASLTCVSLLLDRGLSCARVRETVPRGRSGSGMQGITYGKTTIWQA